MMTIGKTKIFSCLGRILIKWKFTLSCALSYDHLLSWNRTLHGNFLNPTQKKKLFKIGSNIITILIFFQTFLLIMSFIIILIEEFRFFLIFFSFVNIMMSYNMKENGLNVFITQKFNFENSPPFFRGHKNDMVIVQLNYRNEKQNYLKIPLSECPFLKCPVFK